MKNPPCLHPVSLVLDPQRHRVVVTGGTQQGACAVPSLTPHNLRRPKSPPPPAPVTLATARRPPPHHHHPAAMPRPRMFHAPGYRSPRAEAPTAAPAAAPPPAAARPAPVSSRPPAAPRFYKS